MLKHREKSIFFMKESRANRNMHKIGRKKLEPAIIPI